MVLDAGLVSRTVCVSTAADLAEVMLADLPVEAFAVPVALHVAPALDAAFVQCTVLVAAAAHSAIAQVADVSWDALIVLGAAHGLADAGNIGVRASHERRRAGAHHAVVHHLALRIWTTGCATFAGVSALIADTGKVVQALFVGPASDLTFV